MFLFASVFSGNPNCPVFSYLKMVSKLSPKCKYLWQRVREKFDQDDAVWFCGSPLGKNSISKMMPTISILADLSQRYTNHSIRTTSITTLDGAGHEGRHIMKVSGHKSETSIKHYSHHVSEGKKKDMSDSLAKSLGLVTVPSATVSVNPEIADPNPLPVVHVPAPDPVQAPQPVLALEPVHAPQSVPAPDPIHPPEPLKIVVTPDTNGILLPVDKNAPVQNTGMEVIYNRLSTSNSMASQAPMFTNCQIDNFTINYIILKKGIVASMLLSLKKTVQASA